MRNDSAAVMEQAAIGLEKLKELRGGKTGPFHRRIANDPPLLEAFTGMYETCARQISHLPARYKDLILFAIGCAQGNETAVHTHSALAMEHGASIEELGETLRLVFLMCGCGGLITGSQIFEELA